MSAPMPRVAYGAGTTLIILLLFSTLSSMAFANPGDLDPSFGAGGRAFIDFPDHLEAATSIVQARDGKLLIGRYVYYDWPAVDDFSVVRLNVDGAMDLTFGTGGRAFADAGELRGVTLTVLETADGKIVVAGEVANDGGFPQGFGLARFTAAGAIDPSFGVNGVVTGTLNGRAASFQALVEQPNGKLVAAGYVETASDSHDMVIARFDASGSLDETFDTDGFRIVDFFDAGESDSAWEVVRQPDGRFVVAGRALDATGKRHLALFRTMDDGSIDTTFGSSGFVGLRIEGLARADISLQQHADGKLVVSGQTFDQSAQACSAVVARMSSDGSLDPTLGTDGIAEFPLGRCTAEGVSSIALNPDGAIIVGNTITPHTYPSNATVTRLTAAGELDGAFGVGGTTLIDMGSAWGGSHVDPVVGITLVRQTDGRIALATSDQFDWWFGGGFFMVARLLAEGGSVGLIGLASDSSLVNESAGSASVIVRRTGGSEGAVSVDYATMSDTASAADFTNATGTLTWPDGDASDRTISIPITDDALSEQPEAAIVTLSNPTGGIQLATETMYVVIEDDEPPVPIATPAPETPTPPTADVSGGGGLVDAFFLIALAVLLAPGLRCAFYSNARGVRHPRIALQHQRQSRASSP